MSGVLIVETALRQKTEVPGGLGGTGTATWPKTLFRVPEPGTSEGVIQLTITSKNNAISG